MSVRAKDDDQVHNTFRVVIVRVIDAALMRDEGLILRIISIFHVTRRAWERMDVSRSRDVGASRLCAAELCQLHVHLYSREFHHQQ